MMKKKYDCIVIGAGPSGLMAARELSAAGQTVLLVDVKKDIEKVNRSCCTMLINEPNTICALESGVERRMLNVWASRSCVIADAVNTGARKHIKASCVIDAHWNVVEALLASSASDGFCPLTEPTSENRTATSITPR